MDAFQVSNHMDLNDLDKTLFADPNEKFEGNTILRGGQQPRVNKDSIIIS
ncbi:hypothetical protein [Sphingobacterium daejeonense]|nr:hypothetical protein [Sphingobacterium daejeonense]